MEYRGLIFVSQLVSLSLVLVLFVTFYVCRHYLFLKPLNILWCTRAKAPGDLSMNAQALSVVLALVFSGNLWAYVCNRAYEGSCHEKIKVEKSPVWALYICSHTVFLFNLTSRGRGTATWVCILQLNDASWIYIFISLQRMFWIV